MECLPAVRFISANHLSRTKTWLCGTRNSGSFASITAGLDGVSGQFNDVILPTLGNGRTWEVVYTGNSVMLNVMVPIPGGVGLGKGVRSADLTGAVPDSDGWAAGGRRLLLLNGVILPKWIN